MVGQSRGSRQELQEIEKHISIVFGHFVNRAIILSLWQIMNCGNPVYWICNGKTSVSDVTLDIIFRYGSVYFSFFVISKLAHKCCFLAYEKMTFWELYYHDDVTKWKDFPCYWHFVWGIHRSPANSSHKGQWRGALMFTLICTWTNG